uniref:TLC domain-containing protein n=1 Tax=Phaeomonas parva TaxID=124430 RepID=A0A7S1TX13_9STRA|mmetsp:Transcript_21244/g.64701  ORF Transcript_21244/g.64701 Transcript_21244/m.64701 type:complete len:221 (+) Transcript_21244:290-952(+)
MAPTVAQRGYLAFLDATVEPFRPLGVMRNSGVDLAAILRIVALFEAAYWAFRLGVRGYQRRRGGTKGKADEDMLWFGGSYVVTLVMSAFVAVRGTALFMLLLTLAAPKGVTTFGVLSEVQDPEEADFFARAMAHATYTNEVFLAYLVYDIMHMAYQFKGYYRTDMALHHAGFLFCSTFCQSYSAMVFAFSWLIQGEVRPGGAKRVPRHSCMFWKAAYPCP